jgi:hypothetical protein
VSETVVKRLSITFDDGLPLGVHGSFSYEGERWIAVPLTKYTNILNVTDRAIGILNHTRDQLTRWVNAHPEDAERVVMILQTLSHADTQELVHEKTRAQRP